MLIAIESNQFSLLSTDLWAGSSGEMGFLMSWAPEVSIPDCLHHFFLPASSLSFPMETIAPVQPFWVLGHVPFRTPTSQELLWFPTLHRTLLSPPSLAQEVTVICPKPLSSLFVLLFLDGTPLQPGLALGCAFDPFPPLAFFCSSPYFSCAFGYSSVFLWLSRLHVSGRL
jgi:hypothetical protein